MPPSNSPASKQGDDGLHELLQSRRGKEAPPPLTAVAYLIFGLSGGAIGTVLALFAAAFPIAFARRAARLMGGLRVVRPVLDSWYYLGPILAAGFVIGAWVAIRFLLRSRGEASEYHRMLEERDRRLEEEVRDLGKSFIDDPFEGRTPYDAPSAQSRKVTMAEPRE